MARKLLIIQTAALGRRLLAQAGVDRIGELPVTETAAVFPAVTCAAQASFRTASPPKAHGMVANGRYFPELAKVLFWEQSARLVAGERIWRGFRARGRRVGMLFWQQSLGEAVDMVLSPAPIHKHHGGMIMDCASRPAELYSRLCDEVGTAFKLSRYWGPMASAKVGDWIAAATACVVESDDAPELLLTYLPTLDYDLQRHGPGHAKARAALGRAITQLTAMVTAARQRDYDVLVWGDYAIGPCERAVLPNRALRQAGLLATRSVKGMAYPDFFHSRALAVVDHEVACVHVVNPADIPATREVLAGLDGVAEVLAGPELAEVGMDHAHAGQLVLLAAEGCWFAYPWWADKRERPDYATHIDIHNKPGFDPCELFFGWPPPSVCQDPSRIRGTHGRVGPDRAVAVATTLELPAQPESIQSLAGQVKDWLGQDV